MVSRGDSGFGYLSARTAARVNLRQVEGENEWLREQHREGHLRNRQTTYHEFLDADRAVMTALATDEAGFRDQFLRWEHFANGVRLFGTQEASDAVSKLIDLYFAIAVEADRRDKSGAALLRVFEEFRDDLTKARAALFRAMRIDVQPR